MSLEGNAALSMVITGDDLYEAAIQEIKDNADGSCYMHSALRIGVGGTETIDFGDLKMAPRAIFLLSDAKVKCDFGAAATGSAVIIRSFYATSCQVAAPPDQFRIINDQAGVTINVRVMAYGPKL